jgi:AcrR family transcriptional regulator
MDVARAPVELLEKNKPRQERAKRTYESILNATAALLIEVGVERVSTNLIAERAGITVPAVYRYFPNKYAVLHALGAVVMDKQNQVCQDWFNAYSTEGGSHALLENLHELLTFTYRITKEQPAGREILQCLRAVAPLQELRLRSHEIVAEQFSAMLAQIIGGTEHKQLSLHGRLSIDTGYAIVEMALEDTAIPAADTLREGAHMISLYWADVLRQNHLDFAPVAEGTSV